MAESLEHCWCKVEALEMTGTETANQESLSQSKGNNPASATRVENADT
jgi:hypothetical protein